MRTPSDKERFLEELKEIPIVSAVCKRVGISKASVYRWLKDDLDFAKEVENALSKGRDTVTDLAEGQLISLIKKGNLQAIKTWLESNTDRYFKPKKARDPEFKFQPIINIHHDLLHPDGSKEPKDLPLEEHPSP